MKPMNLLTLCLQIVLLLAISEFGNLVVRASHAPIPGSIVGLVVLFILLKLKVIKLKWVDRGGTWLISNMLIFFVPSSLGIIQYGGLVRSDGLRLVLSIGLSTVVVMLSTGLLAEGLTNWKKHRKEQKRVECS